MNTPIPTGIHRINTSMTGVPNCYYPMFFVDSHNPYCLRKGYYFFDSAVETLGWREFNKPLEGYIGPFPLFREMHIEQRKYHRAMEMLYRIGADC